MAAASTNLVNASAVMSIRHLELRARVVVEGFWNGLHRSPFHGFSVEFTEYRQYTPGDDTRYIDWRLFGRSDRYYIKKFEDETNLRCYFVVDQSRSMQFGSLGYSKSEYAATLAASLGYFLEMQGDAIGLLTFSDRVREFLPARHRPGHLRQFMLMLENQPEGEATYIERALQRISEIIRKRGLIVLISDFLSPLETLEKTFGQLRAWGHEIATFQVMDPAELDLSLNGSTLFRDLESNREVYIDPAVARSTYMERLSEHNRTLGEICRKLGVNHHFARTDRPLEQCLLEFLLSRRRFGKEVRRRSSSAG